VIIYYDSHCALCHGAVQFILNVDRNSVFWFAPLSQLENRHQFNFPDSLVLEKNGKYYFEGKAIKEEIGDVLFSVVNLARYIDIPAEDMLRATNRKFTYRFEKIEEELEAKGKKLEESTLEEMDEIWERAKGIRNS